MSENNEIENKCTLKKNQWSQNLTQKITKVNRLLTILIRGKKQKRKEGKREEKKEGRKGGRWEEKEVTNIKYKGLQLVSAVNFSKNIREKSYQSYITFLTEKNSDHFPIHSVMPI